MDLCGSYWIIQAYFRPCSDRKQNSYQENHMKYDFLPDGSKQMVWNRIKIRFLLKHLVNLKSYISTNVMSTVFRVILFASTQSALLKWAHTRRSIHTKQVNTIAQFYTIVDSLCNLLIYRVCGIRGSRNELNRSKHSALHQSTDDKHQEQCGFVMPNFVLQCVQWALSS